MAFPLHEADAVVDGRVLTLTRSYSAPRELVYRLWTDPDHLQFWWGPQGFAITHRETDIRPGGVWRFVMHGPDGTDFPNKIVYLDMIEPERLVYAHGDDDREHFRVTVTFDEDGETTDLTMRSEFHTSEDLAYVVRNFNAVENAKSTLARLAERLSQLQA